MQPLKTHLRRWLIHLTQFALRRIASPISPEPSTRFLVVAPHPDDETLGCGAWIAACRALDLEVRVIILSDGAASHPQHPTLIPAALAEQRQLECRAACARLGLPPDAIEFWGLPDGQLDHLPPASQAATIAKLSALATTLRYPVWLVPSSLEASSEHLGARALIDEALRTLPVPPALWEYFIWAWRNPLPLWPRLTDLGWMCHQSADPEVKTAAIACHRSQVQPVPPWPHPVLEPFLVEALAVPYEFYLRPR